MGRGAMKQKQTWGGRLKKHARRRLASGILVLVPLALTFFVLNLLYKGFTGVILPFLAPLRGELPHYTIVVLAVVGTFLVVYTVGLVTTHFVGQRLLRFGESLILRVPIAKTIYAASKQIVSMMTADNSTAFKAVVLVEFPRPGTLGVGFATGRMTDEQGKPHYSVFIPTTPNPTSGFLILVPAEEVRFTTMTVEEGVKLIVSGGVLTPEAIGAASASILDTPRLPEVEE